MRFHKGHDGWGRDSYTIPQFAVVGSSDCGEGAAVASSDKVRAELEDFRKVLRANHIQSRIRFTLSGNCCMIKRWVVVHSKDFVAANKLAAEYLPEHKYDTRYIHEAA